MLRVLLRLRILLLLLRRRRRRIFRKQILLNHHVLQLFLDSRRLLRIRRRSARLLLRVLLLLLWIRRRHRRRLWSVVHIHSVYATRNGATKAMQIGNFILRRRRGRLDVKVTRTALHGDGALAQFFQSDKLRRPIEMTVEKRIRYRPRRLILDLRLKLGAFDGARAHLILATKFEKLFIRRNWKRLDVMRIRHVLVANDDARRLVAIHVEHAEHLLAHLELVLGAIRVVQKLRLGAQLAPLFARVKGVEMRLLRLLVAPTLLLRRGDIRDVANSNRH